MSLIRKGNTQYAGNLSNNLVSKIGCKGTTCPKLAAAGKYQAGGTGAIGDRGYETSIVDGIGPLKSPLRTYAAAPNESVGAMKVQSLPRGGNNFPKVSPAINQLTAKVLSGGRKKKGTRRKGTRRKSFHKGSKSITMPGLEDFTTKKKSKRYDEKRLRRLFGRKTARAPIFPFVGGRGAKGYSHPKKGQKSRTHKGRLAFTTKRGNKYFDRHGHRKRHAQGSRKKRHPYMKGGSGLPPLEFSKVPPATAEPIVSKPNSQLYGIGSSAGKGGRLANPIPYVASPACPLQTKV